MTKDGSCIIAKTVLIMVTACWDKMFTRELAQFVHYSVISHLSDENHLSPNSTEKQIS